MVFSFTEMLMHQPRKKIKGCEDFLLSHPRDEVLQKDRICKILDKREKGSLICLPVQAKADFLVGQGGRCVWDFFHGKLQWEYA